MAGAEVLQCSATPILAPVDLESTGSCMVHQSLLTEFDGNHAGMPSIVSSPFEVFTDHVLETASFGMPFFIHVRWDIFCSSLRLDMITVSDECLYFYSCGIKINLDSPYILKRGTHHVPSHDPRRFDRLTISPDRINLGEWTISQANYILRYGAEQAPDTSVYIVRPCVYPENLHDHVLGLIIVNFQARYFGLCTVMYVDACHSTH